MVKRTLEGKEIEKAETATELLGQMIKLGERIRFKIGPERRDGRKMEIIVKASASMEKINDALARMLDDIKYVGL